jgi:predicted site-specific integrase-resolvase
LKETLKDVKEIYDDVDLNKSIVIIDQAEEKKKENLLKSYFSSFNSFSPSMYSNHSLQVNVK